MAFFIVSVSPFNAQRNVPLDASVSITFNKAVNLSTLGYPNINLGLPLPGDVSYDYDAATFTITVTRTNPITSPGILFWYVSGVKSFDGEALPSIYEFHYSTVPDDTAPNSSVASTPPNPFLEVQAAYQAAIDRLIALSQPITPLTGGSATFTSASVEVPDTPEDLSADVTLTPDTPGTTAPATIVGASDIPIFDVDPPVVTMPPDPEVPVPVMPEAPTLDTITIPEPPVLPTPAAIVLADMTLPDAPVLAMPTWTASAPEFTTPFPTIDFDYREDQYTSSLVTTLRTALLGTLSGPSGYSNAAETAQFDLTVELDSYDLREEVELVLTECAARGFDAPDDDALREMQKRIRGYQRKRNEFSQKIAEEQMERERQNIEKAIQEIVALDGRFFQAESERAGRLLEAAKFQAQIAFELFEEQVKFYNASVERYQADVEVYKALLIGVRALVEKYKAEVEKVVAQAEGNTILSEWYAAQIEYLTATVQIYRAEVEAQGAKLKVDKAQIEAYAAQVDSYTAQVEGKTAEFQMYVSSVKAVVAQAEAAKSLAEAAAEVAEGTKAQAQEDLELARVGFESRRVAAESAALSHENARLGVEQAAIAVKEAASDVRIQAEKVRAETAEKVAEIDNALKSSRLAQATAAYTLRSTIRQRDKEISAQLNILELTSTTNVAQADMLARIAAAQLLAERWSTSFGEHHGHEHLDGQRAVLANNIAVLYGS